MTCRLGLRSATRTLVASVALAIAVRGLAVPTPIVDAPHAAKTGPAFREALAKRLDATWNNVDLRTIVARIETQWGIAALVDRRIDPSRSRDAELAAVTVETGFDRIAHEAAAEAVVVGHVVTIVPPRSAWRLPALVRARNEELVAASNANRRRELLTRRTIAWADLDRPRDIVAHVAKSFDLTVAGLDRVPHDLWAAATLPDATAVEVLTLILDQFDLTFAWTDDAHGIAIVPIPAEFVIERTFRPAAENAPQAAARLRIASPEMTFLVRGASVVARGTADQHVELVPHIGEIARAETDPVGPPPVPLERRRFTLTLQKASAQALLDKLATSGIDFDYDAAALRAAGVDLARPISFAVRDATADEFFRALCDPLGLDFDIDGLKVTLAPKTPRSP